MTIPGSTDLPLVASALGKRYGDRWAVRDLELAIPPGSVTGVVGANGAGKSTFLRLAAGIARPHAGRIAIFGHDPAVHAARTLPRLGYVDQHRALYPRLSIADTLALGARLNPRWDGAWATSRVTALGLDSGTRCGDLSGGQRTLVAIVLALAKRPDLLLLDEPFSDLDPLARRSVLQLVMDRVAADGTTVVVSSHQIGDLERICDHLLLMAAGTVRLHGALDDLLAAHRWVTGARAEESRLGGIGAVVAATRDDRQATLLVRDAATDLPDGWQAADARLDELVLAYLGGQIGSGT